MRMRMTTCRRWKATTTSRLVNVSLVASCFFCDLYECPIDLNYVVETLM
jgi:hypothetical protein